MGDVVSAASIMTGVALFFGVILAVAYRFLKVEEDPRIEQVEDLLPASNCGACGEAGCRAFAERLVAAEVQASKCTVSSPAQIDVIAAFLGVDAGEQDKRVARLHCAGGTSRVKRIAAYDGLESCRAAVQVNGGGIACAWGCLGLADCERSCTFDAIKMNADSLPVVDVVKCTACNDCVEVCPRDLFSLEPLATPLLVQCASPLTGDAALAVCSVACDACGRCASDAGKDVIEMQGGLPRIRLPKLGSVDATLRCPTAAIRWVPKNQFQEDGDNDA